VDHLESYLYLHSEASLFLEVPYTATTFDWNFNFRLSHEWPSVLLTDAGFGLSCLPKKNYHTKLRSGVAHYVIFFTTLFDIIFRWWLYTCRKHPSLVDMGLLDITPFICPKCYLCQWVSCSTLGQGNDLTFHHLIGWVEGPKFLEESKSRPFTCVKQLSKIFKKFLKSGCLQNP
jgi:hypothetical protein